MSKFNAQESAAFHTNAALDGRTLDPTERVQYFRKYLPPTPDPSQEESSASRLKQRSRFSKSSSSRSPAHAESSSTPRRQRKKPVRTFVWSQLHTFLFSVIHFFFSIYVRIRKLYRALIGRIFSVLYYHHRTPELIQKDVKALDRMPKHLSVVLQYNPEEGLEGLVNDVAEISAWCASAQIPMLSVYEKSGM